MPGYGGRYPTEILYHVCFTSPMNPYAPPSDAKLTSSRRRLMPLAYVLGFAFAGNAFPILFALFLRYLRFGESFDSAVDSVLRWHSPSKTVNYLELVPSVAAAILLGASATHGPIHLLQSRRSRRLLASGMLVIASTAIFGALALFTTVVPTPASNVIRVFLFLGFVASFTLSAMGIIHWAMHRFPADSR